MASGGFLVDGAMLNVTSSYVHAVTLETHLTCANAPILLNSALLGRGMMLDTGAFGAYIPPEYLATIYGPVEGSSLLDDGAWSVPCDTGMNVSVMFGFVCHGFHRRNEVLNYDVRI